MTVLGAGGETGAGGSGEELLAVVTTEDDFAFEDEDEFILERMVMPHRGFFAGEERGQIDSDLGQAEGVRERALLSGEYAGAEGLGVTGGRARLDGRGIERWELERHG